MAGDEVSGSAPDEPRPADDHSVTTARRDKASDRADEAAPSLLNVTRLTVYPRIFIALYIAMIAGWWVVGSDGLLDPQGTPVGGDFVTFYGASELLADAPGEALYDRDQLLPVEQDVVSEDIEFYAWHYPPPFMLVVEPLRAVPYVWALVLWTAISLAAYLVMVRRLEPHPLAIGVALGFAGFFQNVLHGQNGVLTLVLLGSGLLLLDRRPVAAGAVLGLLLYKPHFLPLAGLALLAGRRWKAIAGMAASAATVTLLSAAVYGVSTWEAFVDNLDFAQDVFYRGGLDWDKMPTLSSMLLLLGVPVGATKGIQAIFGLVVAGVVALAWYRNHPQRASILVVAALLATPFAFEYDLTILVLPIAWLATDGRTRGWLPGDRAALVVTWLLPLFLAALAAVTSVQVGPLVLCWLLFVAWRRGSVVADAPPTPASVS